MTCQKVKHRGPGPTAHKWQSQDLNSGSLGPEPFTLLYLHCPHQITVSQLTAISF